MQNRIMPQEKVHIMTDRNLYVGGDTIWLRPFIVDGLTMKPALFSRFLYVELLSQTDSLVYRAKLHMQPERDVLTMRGYVPLDPTLPSGIYTLVGYTRWMLNAGEQYFFKRNVQVVNARELYSGAYPMQLTQTTQEDAYHPIDRTSLLKADHNPRVYHPEIKTDKDSGITDDPNTYGDEKYIFNLLISVISVSLRTLELIDSMPEYKEI